MRWLTPSTMADTPGYSQVVTVPAGRLAFVAGQVALDPDGTLVGEDDPAAQAQAVFRNLKLALEAAGTSFEQIIKLTTFVTDIRNLPAFRAAWQAHIDPDHAPASTLVEVASLFRPEFLLEVEAVARIPEAAS